jgi:hypothetical protein
MAMRPHPKPSRLMIEALSQIWPMQIGSQAMRSHVGCNLRSFTWLCSPTL